MLSLTFWLWLSRELVNFRYVTCLGHNADVFFFDYLRYLGLLVVELIVLLFLGVLFPRVFASAFVLGRLLLGFRILVWGLTRWICFNLASNSLAVCDGLCPILILL